MGSDTRQVVSELNYWTSHPADVTEPLGEWETLISGRSEVVLYPQLSVESRGDVG